MQAAVGDIVILFISSNVKLIDGVKHHVTEERFCAAESARTIGEATFFGSALFQEVNDFKLQGERLVFQEGLRDGCVHEPLVMVEQFVGIATSAVVDEAGVDAHAEGEVHLRVEAHFINMSVLIVLGRLLVGDIIVVVLRLHRNAPPAFAEVQLDARRGVEGIDRGESVGIAHIALTVDDGSDVARFMCRINAGISREHPLAVLVKRLLCVEVNATRVIAVHLRHSVATVSRHGVALFGCDGRITEGGERTVKAVTIPTLGVEVATEEIKVVLPFLLQMGIVSSLKHRVTRVCYRHKVKNGLLVSIA